MTFTSKDKWLYEHQEYIAATELVIHESNAFFELADATPMDSEAIARQRSKYKAAIESRQEVHVRLTAEHSTGRQG